MTIPNRTVTMTGVFAKDANTSIPTTPVAGTSYRKTDISQNDVEKGWPFKNIVDSAKFNQILFETTTMTQLLEKYGILPWSNSTDYEVDSLCVGSNGKLYKAVQASGPSSSYVDPTTDDGTNWVEPFMRAYGDQTKYGTTEFNGFVYHYQDVRYKGVYTLGTAPSEVVRDGYYFVDSNGLGSGGMNYVYNTSGSVSVGLTCRSPFGNQDTFANWHVGWTENGERKVSTQAEIRSVITQWGRPNWNGGISISFDENNHYTAPSDGYIVIKCRGVNSYDAFKGAISSYEIDVGGDFGSYHDKTQTIIPVIKGNILTKSETHGAPVLTFFPAL